MRTTKTGIKQEETGSLYRARIMVVDDDSEDLTLLQVILERDYDVTLVNDPRRALEMLQSGLQEGNPFDVVLSDVKMPIMDGFSVTNAIRNLPDVGDTPVILISGMSETEDIVRGLQMGANDYITKPVNTSMVRARVRIQVTLKRLMDERKQTIAELKETQKVRERFFRIASHDLKGPINNIGMAQTMLMQTVGEDHAASEYVSLIEKSLDNMKDVIRDFLDTAALQTGALDIRLDCIAAEDVINEVLEQYDINARRKGITMQVSETSGQMMADRARIGQVLSNLVSNALKYGPPNSSVYVWTEAASDDMLRISVADQGRGIPANERERLFGEFSKLSTRPTGGESSTGLGLWIVKHLVTLQNGTVGVDCPPTGGSIFWIELPACALE